MEISNELNVGSREQLRAWLSDNHDSCDEVWIVCCRSGRVHTCGLPYLDVVYEALCFGWIDSTCKRVGDKMLQRLTPRAADLWNRHSTHYLFPCFALVITLIECWQYR